MVNERKTTGAGERERMLNDALKVYDNDDTQQTPKTYYTQD